MQSPCRLYLITPPQFTLNAFMPRIEAAFDGGDIACLQLRLKDVADDDILRAGEKLLPLCNRYGASFIVNDRPDLALNLGADGVHIGLNDVGEDKEGYIASIRAKVGPHMVIGASCYDSPDNAMIAAEEGADYVAFGAFHPTKTKVTTARPTPDILEWWSSYTVIPCVAIGGITAQNCAPIVQAGADFIAVVSAVWDHAEGPAKAVAEINNAIQEAVAKREAN
jgi:thiamine-phosphate pyrophosphorylase